MGKRLDNCPCCGTSSDCDCCIGPLPSSIFLNIPGFTCGRCTMPGNAWSQLIPLLSAGLSVSCVGHTGCGALKRKMYTSELIYDETVLQNALNEDQVVLALASATVVIDGQCPPFKRTWCQAIATLELGYIYLWGDILYGISNNELWDQFLRDQSIRIDAFNTTNCPGGNTIPIGRLLDYDNEGISWVSYVSIVLGSSEPSDPFKGFTNGRCNSVTIHHDYFYNQNNINQISPYPFPDILIS